MMIDYIIFVTLLFILAISYTLVIHCSHLAFIKLTSLIFNYLNKSSKDVCYTTPKLRLLYKCDFFFDDK